MAKVYQYDKIVPRIARNHRIYTGSYFSGSSNGNTSQAVTSKIFEVIPFADTQFPEISDYSIYAATYGQYPVLRIFVIDEDGNRLESTQVPKFIMVDGSIESITFDLGFVQTGFIYLS